MSVEAQPGAARTRPAAGPERPGGYAAIADYAAVGDGRTLALVARDGAVDWLCLPELDSRAVFGALLDADRGGQAVLAPDVSYDVTRRYLPGTNVLETTFTTGAGSVRVTDAMTLPGVGLGPARELARRIEGVSGTVPLRWSVEPRFGYGMQRTRLGRRAGVPVASAGNQALAVCSWGAGEPQVDVGGVSGRVETQPGSRALLALCAADQEPLVLPARGEVEARLDDTVTRWRGWAGCPGYDGPWRPAVERSALALKLLAYAPSGALAAAATTSLPEEIGGVRNWDYRYCWVRDSAFTLSALLQLGYADEAEPNGSAGRRPREATCGPRAATTSTPASSSGSSSATSNPALCSGPGHAPGAPPRARPGAVPVPLLRRGRPERQRRRLPHVFVLAG